MKDPLKSRSLSGQPSRAFLITGIALLCTLGIMAYSNTLDATFHFDDEVSIVDNLSIRDLSDPSQIWAKYKHRVIPYWTFALNYHFGGLRVFDYHVFNISIHLAGGIVVFFLILATFRTRGLRGHPLAAQSHWVALFTGLIFVLHPLQTQSVTYLVQRIASLSSLFYLSALLLYVQARLKGSAAHYIAALFAGLCAAFSKENAATLPAAIFIYELYFLAENPKQVQKTLLRALPFLAPVLLLFAVYVLPMASQSNFDRVLRVQTETSRLDYLFTQFNVLITYLRLLFLPVHQNLDYAYPLSQTLWEPKTLLSLAFLSTLFVLAVLLANRQRIVSFCILWFFLTLSIESSILPIKDVIFEHRLYLPLFGFAFFAASTGAQLLKKPKIYTAAFSLLIILLGILTFQRNRVWKNEATLWADVVKKSPNKVRGLNNLGRALSTAGKHEEALLLFNRALEIKPDEAEVYNNLGALFAQQGQDEKAVAAHLKAAEINPENPNPYFNLGHLYSENNQLDKAIEYYEEALKRHVHHTQAWTGLGVAHHRREDYTQAIEFYRKALAIDAHFGLAYYNMGLAYGKLNQDTKAVENYLAALQRGFDEPDVYYQLGALFLDLRDLDAAYKYLASALMRDPKHPRANRAIGLVHVLRGESAEAKNQARFLRSIGRHDLANEIVEAMVG